MREWNDTFDITLFLFFWYPELKSAPCTCQADTVPLSYIPSPIWGDFSLHYETVFLHLTIIVTIAYKKIVTNAQLETYFQS